MITLIVAHDLEGGIGKDGDMPWGMSLKDDLDLFRNLTNGHVVIMGSKTFASIGKPLSNRINGILTSQDKKNENGIWYFNSLESVMKTYEWFKTIFPKEEWFIIGGQSVYEQFLPFADRVIKTVIYEVFECDTFFPPLGTYGKWKGRTLDVFSKNERNAYGGYISEYTRIWGEEDGKEETTSLPFSD